MVQVVLLGFFCVPWVLPLDKPCLTLVEPTALPAGMIAHGLVLAPVFGTLGFSLSFHLLSLSSLPVQCSVGGGLPMGFDPTLCTLLAQRVSQGRQV